MIYREERRDGTARLDIEKCKFECQSLARSIWGKGGNLEKTFDGPHAKLTPDYRHES